MDAMTRILAGPGGLYSIEPGSLPEAGYLPTVRRLVARVNRWFSVFQDLVGEPHSPSAGAPGSASSSVYFVDLHLLVLIHQTPGTCRLVIELAQPRATIVVAL